MWAIEKSKPEPGLWRIEAPIPTAGPKDVRIKVTAFAICGTDLHIVDWDRWAASRIKTPMVFGHEFTGVVESIGAEVKLVQVGDRVTGETHIYDGLCYACRRGLQHLCENVQILGVDRQGAFADYVVLPEQNVWKIHPDIPEEIAAIHDPLGNAVHTALAGPVAGLRFSVFGCGPIGCFAIGVLKAAGAAWVAAVDKNPPPARDRRAHGRGPDPERGAGTGREADPGCHERPRRGRHAGDVRPSRRLPRRIRIPGERGRVSLLGIPSKPLEIDVAKEVIFRGAQVQGINGRLIFDTWYRMEALLTSGKLDVRPVLTHILGWSDFEEAVELQRSGRAGRSS